MKKQIEVNIASPGQTNLGFHLYEGGGFLSEGYVPMGGRYIRAEDISKVLKSAKPRTDADRIDFIDDNRFDIDRSAEGFSIWCDKTQEFIFGEHDTWRQAVDAIMDAEEMV